jgi:hypothetical protein
MGVGRDLVVIYVHVIKKVVGYAHAMKKFPRTCMPRTQSLLTRMPFRPGCELTVSNRQVKLPFYPLVGPTKLLAHLPFCDTPGFQPGSLTLMNRPTKLTLVKRRSTWAITSKTSPMTPNDPFWSTLVNPWSNPTQNPLNTPLPSLVSHNFCRILQISPKHFKISQCKSCVFCRGTQLSC